MSDAWRHRRPEHNQAPGLKRRAHLFAGCSQVVEVRCAVVLDRCGDGNDIERTSGCPSMSGTRPVEVANMSDAGLSEPGLPEHEDDTRRAEDTGTGEQNP